MYIEIKNVTKCPDIKNNKLPLLLNLLPKNKLVTHVTLQKYINNRYIIY